MESKGNLDSSSVKPSAPSGSVVPENGVRIRPKVRPAEHAVIDEELVLRSVKEERQSIEATQPNGGTSDVDGEIDLHTLDSLTLSFANIAKIDNLLGYESLVRLRLDNNEIRVIENIDHLTRLQWLDLSFNNIHSISGLTKLTNLTDLSLFDNEIESLDFDQLAPLRDLQVLSLGNNRISSLDEVKRLRSLKKLRLLNLKGNPVCELSEYRDTIVAYLPQLKYLDYELIDPTVRSKACERLLEELQVIEVKESLQMQAEEQQRRMQQDLVQERAANVEGVKQLFDTMVRDDSEYPKLYMLPEYDRVLAGYRLLFQRTIDEFVPAMVAKHQEKEAEKKLFEQALTQAKQQDESKCIERVQLFERVRKRAFNLYIDGFTSGSPEPAILQQLLKDVQQLSDELMDLEMVMVDQVNDLLSTFEDSYMSLVTSNVNRIQNAFRCLEDVGNHYVEQLHELVQQCTVQMSNESIDLSPEAAALLADKDAVKNAVTTSHDNHLSRIVAKSDELNEREDRDAKQLLRTLKTAAYDRNRRRVSEIFELVERHRRLIRDKLEVDEEANPRDAS